MSKACLEELYAKLKKKSEACLTRNNRLFIVGGSKDMLLPLPLWSARLLQNGNHNGWKFTCLHFHNKTPRNKLRSGISQRWWSSLYHWSKPIPISSRTQLFKDSFTFWPWISRRSRWCYRAQFEFLKRVQLRIFLITKIFSSRHL